MKEHEILVKDLAKPGELILSELTPEEAHLIHMAMCIAGEAGEIIDAVKRQAIYRKPLDVENLKEELGDLEFYIEGLRQAVGLSREEVLQHNIRKLRKRYGEKYSDKAAIERTDKEEVVS